MEPSINLREPDVSAAMPASDSTVLIPRSEYRTLAITPDMPITEVPTSLDIRDPRQRAMLFNVGNPADYQLNGQGQLTIKATHWVVYPESRTDEKSGEVRDYAVIVLIDHQGKTFKTTSEYAPRRLRAALELYSRAEWDAGVTFVVQPRPSKRHPGGTYHDIRIVIDEQDRRA